MKWAKMKIRDTGRIVTGKTPPTGNRDFFDGDYLFVTPTDLDFHNYYIYQTKTTISEVGKSRHINQFLPANSVMYTCIGNTIGKIGLNKNECLTNQQINSIIPNNNHDFKFLYYYLISITPFIKNLGGGVATPIVNKSTFEDIDIYIPPLPIQRKIASILSAYDDLIENNLKRIKLLEERAFLRYKQIVKEEKMNEFLIQEICESIGGGTPSTGNNQYWDGGDILWFSPTDLTKHNSIVLLDSEKKITELGLQKSSAKLVPPKTILMTSRASIGYFGLINRTVSTNQGFINIIPKKEYYRAYLLFNLKSRKEEIIGNANGSTFLEISKTKFRQMKVKFPADESVLVEFESEFEGIFIFIENLLKQNNKLREARDILLPRLMNGQIEV